LKVGDCRNMDEPIQFPAVCEVCGTAATMRALEVSHRKWIREHRYCEKHGNEFHNGLFTPDVIGSFTERPLDSTREFDIEMLIFPKDLWHAHFYLREKHGRRLFACQVGDVEALSLYWSLKPADPENRTMHEVVAQVVEQMGGSIRHGIIWGYKENENWFHGTVLIAQGDREIKLPVQPGAAVNIAIASNTPIFVSESAWRLYTSYYA
jgi:bifunctional DNase/RNase